MEQLIKQILDYLMANYALYMVVTMGVIISLTIAILTLIKKPIKLITGKIKNEKLRKLANKPFIILAFAISACIWGVLSFISQHYFPFETIKVLLTGAFSIVVYAFGDGIITKPTAEQLVETIKEIDEDNAITDEDKTAVQDFWDIVKK